MLDLDASTIVHEKLDRTPYGKTPDEPWGEKPFLSWGPPIIDLKGVVGDLGFALKPNLAIIDEFDQQLAVVLPLGCGGTQRFELNPTFHFQMIKVDAGHWKLHQP